MLPNIVVVFFIIAEALLYYNNNYYQYSEKKKEATQRNSFVIIDQLYEIIANGIFIELCYSFYLFLFEHKNKCQWSYLCERKKYKN